MTHHRPTNTLRGTEPQMWTYSKHVFDEYGDEVPVHDEDAFTAALADYNKSIIQCRPECIEAWKDNPDDFDYVEGVHYETKEEFFAYTNDKWGGGYKSPIAYPLTPTASKDGEESIIDLVDSILELSMKLKQSLNNGKP
jgi:hypothetical protein